MPTVTPPSAIVIVPSLLLAGSCPVVTYHSEVKVYNDGTAQFVPLCCIAVFFCHLDTCADADTTLDVPVLTTLVTC